METPSSAVDARTPADMLQENNIVNSLQANTPTSSTGKNLEKAKGHKRFWYIISVSLVVLIIVIKYFAIIAGLFILLFLLSLLIHILKTEVSTESKTNISTENKKVDINVILAEIDEMDGFEFERYVKHIYESLGYSVHHTPLSGDQGVDLILTSKEGIRTAIQVKRYSSKVSNGAVQEVVAGKGFHKCTKGSVVTNNFFTNSAVDLAIANGIDLVDRDGLEKMIKTTL